MGGSGSKKKDEVKVIAVSPNEKELPYSPSVKKGAGKSLSDDGGNPFAVKSEEPTNPFAASGDMAMGKADTLRSSWGKVLAMDNKVGEEEPKHLDSQLPSMASTSDYAMVIIQEPSGLRASAEAGRVAKMLLDCLEVRKKYIGPKAGRHMEPKCVQVVDKEQHKIVLAKTCREICGESVLQSNQGAADGGKRIEWDPFEGEPPPLDGALRVSFEEGVFCAYDKEAGNAPVDASAKISETEFGRDYMRVLQAMRDRSCISFCMPRLQELDLRYQLYSHRNHKREAQRQKDVAGRDWYQVRKVDTHIHHSACFSQRQLMSFIRRKMIEDMDKVVMEDKGKPVTLKEVFGNAGLNNETEINAENLCCMASMGAMGHHDTFGRFDVFNSKYNPFGDKRLRDIFLKTDNYIEGSYLAELTKEVMASYAKQKFVCAEWRISIYGKSKDEWGKLAKWFRTHNIKCPQVRWLIQVPRLYSLFKNIGHVSNFAEMISNIFQPLFEASLDPEKHEDMFYMLQQVVGFDSVDDESQGSGTTLTHYPSPEEWTNNTNPPYTYWMYFMYANIRSLNALRRRRGLNTFTFRPHCGEAGNISHLCSGFMLANSICHGVMLKESPVLQYLYYLAQVGLHVSPLSNDILFIPLEKSPFGDFFRRGLNVSLSTDDPLIIHLTEEALIEEYVVAARTFRLSSCDLCELARLSVLQSGFERPFKEWWVGDFDKSNIASTEPANPFDSSAKKNPFDSSAKNPFEDSSPPDPDIDEKKSNVPTMRLRFRADTLRQEMDYLVSTSGGACPQPSL